MSQKELESRIADKNYREYIMYRDNGEHGKYVDRAKKCNNYYVGEQWDDADKAFLDKVGRPCLTLNLTMNKVNTVAGEQIAKRVDITFKPKGGGANGDVAKSLNAVIRNILDENQFDWRESGVFLDGVIEERGFFDLRLDFSTHIAGEARISVPDNRDILIHPDAREYDPDTWPGVIKTRLYSLDEIEEEFGKSKLLQVERLAEGGGLFVDDSVTFQKDTTFGGDGNTGLKFTGGEVDKRSIQLVRVIDRQYWRLQNAWHFVDGEKGDSRLVPAKWSQKRMEEFAAKNGLYLIKKMAKRVRWTQSVDHVLLHDDWSPFRHLTVVPYFCYFRRGKPVGLVTNLLSPQDNLNKLSSQTLAVINSVANGGWTVEEDSLVNLSVEELEEKGGTTGLVIEHVKGSNPPQKIEANKVPSGLDRMKVDAALQMDKISGIDDVLEGSASGEFSGIALGHQEARGLRKLAMPIDNLRQTRWLLARNLLDLIKDHYKEERIFYVDDLSQPEGEQQQEVIINQRNSVGRVINDISVGEYSITIGTKPARDTFEERQFGEIIELRNIGVQIPDHWVVRYSSLENKGELEKLLAEMTGMGEMTPEQQKAMELQAEVAMLQLQGEVEKLEAEIGEIKSKAELNYAKADELSGEDSRQRDVLEEKLVSKKRELDLRRELGQLSADTKLQDSLIKGETNIEKSRQQSQNRKAA
tara:strand:+ start:3190 stop:5280 length:2091 start_codon:yes stop_codon:yes gene_type:complete